MLMIGLMVVLLTFFSHADCLWLNPGAGWGHFTSQLSWVDT